MLRNHGLLTVGRTIADAFLAMYIFENTCRIQLDAQAGGELVHVNPAIVAGIGSVLKVATAGLGAALVWPALLRKLDRADPSSPHLNRAMQEFDDVIVGGVFGRLRARGPPVGRPEHLRLPARSRWAGRLGLHPGAHGRRSHGDGRPSTTGVTRPNPSPV